MEGPGKREESGSYLTGQGTLSLAARSTALSGHQRSVLHKPSQPQEPQEGRMKHTEGVKVGGPQFVVFANFHGENTPTKSHFKLPTLCN